MTSWGLKVLHPHRVRNIGMEEICLTCQLNANRHSQLCEGLFEDAHWRVAHAYNTSLPGWLIIASLRHIPTIADMNDLEAASLGTLIHRVSKAVQAVTGAVKTYVIQFAEQPGHSHVHFHIVPRMTDIPQERRGVGIFGYLGVPEEQAVSLERRNEIALEVRNHVLLSE